jgi:lysozyme
MADSYNSVLPDVSAPASSRAPSIGSPQIVEPAIGTALKGASQLLVGGATLFDKAQGSEVVKQVDKNIETAFQDSLGVSSDGFINNTLDNLEKLKMAQEQGKDTGDRFYISLVKSSRELKNKYPNRIDEIDKAFKERGLVDPRLSLIKQQADREEEVRKAQAHRENELMDKAYKEGWAIYTTPGDKTSPIDKAATIRMAGDMAANAAESDRIAKSLGIVRDSKGEASFTMRDEFIRNLPSLQKIMWTNALTGIRPELNEFQTMVSNARPEDMPKLKEALLKITAKKDQFMLTAQQDTIKHSMNEKEKEVYMNSAREMMGGLTQGVLDIQNINDLSTMKSIAKIYDFMSINVKMLNMQDAPLMTRLALISPQLLDRYLQLGKIAELDDKKLGRSVGKELNKIVDFAPATPKPSSGDIDLDSSEDKHSYEDKKFRLGEAVTWQQNFINGGVAIRNDDSATGFAWISSQKPLFNAYTRGLDGNGGETLSTNDRATIVKQMTSANYVSNLKVAAQQFPDKGAMIGQYAYNVVTDHVIDQIRALRETSSTFAKFGTDYTLKYDPMQGRFVVAQPFQAGKSPGFQASTDRSRDPEIQKRVAQINEAMPLLLEARKYNPNTAGMKDGDYLASLIGLVNGDMMQQGSTQGGSPQGTPPLAPQAQGSSDMNDVVKKWENDQLKGRGSDGMWKPHTSLEGGTDTIGFGHKLTKEEQAGGFVNLGGEKVSFKEGLTDEQIDDLLNQDMEIANKFVNKEFPNLAQNQKDAVASLVYNVGASEFRSSKAYQALKKGNIEEFAKQAYDPKKGYVRINGQISDGLVNRRTEEKTMFFGQNNSDKRAMIDQAIEKTSQTDFSPAVAGAIARYGIPLASRLKADKVIKILEDHGIKAELTSTGQVKAISEAVRADGKVVPSVKTFAENATLKSVLDWLGY